MTDEATRLTAELQRIRTRQAAALDAAEALDEGDPRVWRHLAEFDRLHAERQEVEKALARATGKPAVAPASEAWRQSPTLQYTAHHEAGHAVVAYALGDTGVTASVIPNATSSGRIIPSRDLQPLDHAAVCYAGRLGGYLSPTPPTPGAGDPAVTDEEMAYRSCGGVSELARRARDRAREVVNSHSRAVCEVARQLVARGTITGADVGSAIEQFPPCW